MPLDVIKGVYGQARRRPKGHIRRALYHAVSCRLPSFGASLLSYAYTGVDGGGGAPPRMSGGSGKNVLSLQ